MVDEAMSFMHITEDTQENQVPPQIEFVSAPGDCGCKENLNPLTH